MIAARPQPAYPRRVLIIKPSALGDVVTAVPVLRGLRRSFPAAHLAWLLSTACAPLVADDGDLDEVILFERQRLGRAWRSPEAAWALAALLARLRRGQFDWVIDLQGLLRSGLLSAATLAPLRAGFSDAREGAAVFYTHRVRPRASHTVERNLALARLLGIDARPEDMTLAPSDEGRAFVEKLCRDRGLEPGEFLACIPPTRWPTKRYPVRHWRTVVAELARHGPVVLLGADGDQALCQAVADGMGPSVVDLAGQTSIPQMVAVIAASAGVVCCDSAAKFIAPAVGVDVVVLVGPTHVGRTGPYGRGRAIVADVPCQGCLKRRCRHRTCMELIDPQEVIAAATEMISRRGA